MKAFHGDPQVKANGFTPHAKADDAVGLVKRWFSKRGWFVHNKRHVCANGSDLVVSKDKWAFSVEVKLAHLSKRMWRVKRVSKNRMGDDLIAIVFPGNAVLVEPMKDHLRLCQRSGDRGVTMQVTLIGLGVM